MPELFLRMENELGKKIIELDARPSDSIVLALQMKQPIHVANKVLENVEDMSEILGTNSSQAGLADAWHFLTV